MQASRGRQFKILRNVVYVVAEVSNVLPRLPNDTGTIKVNLKRKLRYKTSAMSFNVRPHKVIQAANWLMNHSSLYRQEGITVNQIWGVEYRDNCLVDEKNIENEHKGLPNIVNSCANTASNANCDEVVETKDQWSEDEAEIPAGVTDTMLTNTNFVEDNESRCILNVAPGEGNKPLSIFRDQYSEELAYPGIFLFKKKKKCGRKMVASHGIWLLQLFVYFLLVCEVRQSMGKRNYNLTTSHRNRRKFFSHVIDYSPNRDAGHNPCEIPLGCINPNPGPVKNPCALCERAIARNHKSICCEEC